jgi:hypothetical protein
VRNKIILLLFLVFSNLAISSDLSCPTGEHLQLFDEDSPLKIKTLIKRIKPKLQYKGFISPSDLRKYSANTIAELLIDRIEEGCDKIRGGKDNESMEEHSEVMMMVNSNLYDSIDKYGLQNQHVTATSSGISSRDHRYSAESKMIGSVVGYSSKAKDILPKYSGLNVLKKSHFGSDTPYNGASGYGNTAIVFKDHINERVTFTKMDSLGVFSFRGSPIMSSLKFKDKRKKEDHFKCASSYCEAQVWGKVGLDDVKYVLIPPGAPVPEVFKKRGIPVYFYKKGKKGSMAWEKGKIASEGSSVKSYTSKKIDIKCDKCPSVVKKINDHHNYKNLKPKELKKELKKVKSIDQKREILGELVSKEFKGKERFFEKQLKKSSINLDKIISMQALSEYPHNKHLRESILNGLTNTSYEGTEYVMMAMSFAAELEPFKSDKEIQTKLADLVASNSDIYINHFYQYLTTNKSMCDKIPKREHVIPRAYGFGF